MSEQLSISEILADLYKETTQLLSGCRSREELRALFKKTMPETFKEVPETTNEWLKEAIVRFHQRSFYERRGIAVPDQVKKNDQAFFSVPPPEPDLNEANKEIAMKDKKEKKEKKETAGSEPTKERKNKTGDSTITLNAGVSIDDLIKRQKTELVVALMNIIREAGAKGVTVTQLTAEMPKRLKDKAPWEKYKPAVHINYVLKKLTGLVTITAPAATA